MKYSSLQSSRSFLFEKSKRKTKYIQKEETERETRKMSSHFLEEPFVYVFEVMVVR